jgi:triacylglycerol lipase
MPDFDFEPQAAALSLRNARFLGEAAAVAYESEEACRKWAVDHGMDEDFAFFSRADTEGFVAQNAQAIIVAFRGTQPNRPMDWLSDLNTLQVNWDHPVGKVHHGFYAALRAIWGQAFGSKEILPQRLLDRGSRTVWVTGHSLGGALAELCAAQSFFVHHVPVQGVYTFGQPRVGTEQFAEALQAAIGPRIFRFVNDRDIVPRVPLFGMGFRHYGGEVFFDHKQQREERPSVVESLANALRLALLSLDLDPVQEAAKLLASGALKAAFSGNLTGAVQELMKDRELKALGDPKAILARGAENISDHDMRKCYLARLSDNG